MRRWLRMLGTKTEDHPVSAEASQARRNTTSDWPLVHEVKRRTDRLVSQNGFIEALTRAQDRSHRG